MYFKVHFKSVEGLVKEAQIQIAGIKVGVVERTLITIPRSVRRWSRWRFGRISQFDTRRIEGGPQDERIAGR